LPVFSEYNRFLAFTIRYMRFFGIAKRSMPLSLISTEVFDVDYGQTVDDVFIYFTSLLLRNLPTLSPLSTSEGIGLGKREREELPSWCPDYSIKNSMNLNNRREQIQYGIPGFAASLVDGGDSPSCRIDVRILYVPGKRIHKVSEFGPLMNRMFTTHKMHADAGIAILLDICLKMDPRHNLTGQDRLEVLWRTLIQDIDFDGGSRCRCPADHSIFSPLFGAFIALYATVVLKALKEIELQNYLKVLKQWEDSFATSAAFPTVSTILKVAKMSEQGMNGFLTLYSKNTASFVSEHQFLALTVDLLLRLRNGLDLDHNI
jgi:hypothetical protein